MAAPGTRPAAEAPIDDEAKIDDRAPIDELHTLRDWLRFACTRFGRAGVSFGQGTDNAWDEAVWLGLWSLGLGPDTLEPFLDARLTLDERRAFAALIGRRVSERRPAAYLTGEAWLRGVRFRCDERALIPRSLIAEAMDTVLPDWLGQSEPERVLDLCTGGASLAILAALQYQGARVDAADLSADALALADENVALHGVSDRVSLHRGDLFGAIASRRYDLILCNPPYVCDASMRALPAEFGHEPRAALDGGADGMALVRTIVAGAAAHLNPGGALVLEIGHEAAHFEAAFPALEFAYLPVAAGERSLVFATREQLAAAGRASQ